MFWIGFLSCFLLSLVVLVIVVLTEIVTDKMPPGDDEKRIREFTEHYE